MNTVWLINGIPGAGKTTTAKALAARFRRAAHIEGDVVQQLIVAGAVPPGSEPAAESNRQIHLCVRNQCLLARSFLDAGFVPILDYVVVNRERLEEYQGHLPEVEIRLVTIAPGIAVALERDAHRPEKTVGSLWVHLDEMLRRELYPAGVWIDNSHLSIQETVDEVLARYSDEEPDAVE